MKGFLILLTFFLCASAARAQQAVPAYTADRLMQRVNSHPDTTYIINFWATWCGPCVAELHYFDDIQDHYKGKPVKVLLVSFDFKNDYPQKLQTYIKRKGVKPEVLWFSETNANEFIPKIESTWSGAIPATLIVKAGNKYHTFMEKPITAEEVEKVADAAK